MQADCQHVVIKLVFVCVDECNSSAPLNNETCITKFCGSQFTINPNRFNIRKQELFTPNICMIDAGRRIYVFNERVDII